MVNTCWVKDCFNRADDSVKGSFYCISVLRKFEGDQTKKLSEERRRTWLAKVNRKDLPSKYSKICSDHFVQGKPADLYNHTHPDWAPTLKLCDLSSKKVKKVGTDIKRYNRIQDRQKNREKHDIANVLLDLQELQPDYFAQERNEPANHGSSTVCLFTVKGKMEQDKEPTIKANPISQSVVDNEIQHLITENTLLKEKLISYKMNQDSFNDNDEKVKYYTRLPSYMTLMALFEFVVPYIPTNRGSDLGKFEEIIMTLMRLKLNLPLQDIAYRFQISISTVSRTFLIVIHVLYIRLKPLLFWPEREELQLTMPLEFRKDFGGKVAVIIDCFEIFIQRPKSLMARAQTWSSYKHNNTIKFLIGITPQGSVSFLSKAWGGRASDKHISENSGFLSKLLPGDIVLADRGFDISDSIGMYCAKVITPCFTKGKSQLAPVDVENSRKIAHLRIHVERVIGLVRNKYTMLQGKLPVDFLMGDKGEETTAVDKIVSVACCLTNMCESLVPFD